MVTDPAIELVVNTVSASNALLRASRRVFRPFGLSEAQFNVLQVLQDADDQLSQRELSDILIVDRSNITGLIDRMEKAAWVKRQPAPGDRRAYRVALTPDGRRLWRQANAAYVQAIARVTVNLTPAQIKAVSRVLPVMERSAHALELELAAAE
ncbi:MAG: MarR family transcriptional regulator [Opitutaceae bacterium]|jgi:DNA-binding MarR family transcriptional regulator|nr:MarR family transcriptional regulator [Opitutaceae bacterium]